MLLLALVCLCVHLSMTTITKKIVDGFVPNFTGTFIREKEDQGRVSLQSVEGCGSNCQKTPLAGDCLHFILLIVGVASIAKCWQQNPQNFTIG